MGAFWSESNNISHREILMSSKVKFTIFTHFEVTVLVKWSSGEGKEHWGAMVACDSKYILQWNRQQGAQEARMYP